MPANVGHEYEKAEKEYLQAKSLKEKLIFLQKMLSVLPKHKGSEKLQKELKQRISKYKSLLEKEKQFKKRKGKSVNIKKEGSAQVVIIGKTNPGKSTLLSKLTNAKPLIAEYEFTTKRPEIGIMNYKGVLIQVIEIPALTENFIEKEKGPGLLSIIRDSDLIVILIKHDEDEEIIKKELELAGIKKNSITINRNENISNIKDKIWNSLNLIYVFTKTPGKEKNYPPLALNKNSTIKDLALHVHKDFIKKFSFAKVWGKSAKHQGIKCGLKHVLESGDVVELHTK